ncbi:hypothetical protein [Magnetospirillum sp. SS-4]|uniref:hypothetical protein n=1 Tax=Magnetospirillum sp. SS-4 TaxID=2681465 RepID=UPI0013841CB3|nr:hypothetical protein [Magnetospirillum sp. SS-4]CAA7616006.1 conserved exported hypothetical protein [Magnetospirillum sp. SS-4]
MKRLIGALLLALLAACGEIPQPFRHDGINAAVIPRAARGVVVRPLDDGPRAARLAEALASKLREDGIPAATREVVPGALVIQGEVAPTPAGQAIRWVLAQPDGGILGEATQVVAGSAWNVSSMAAEVMDKLGPLLHGEMPDNLSAVAIPTVRLVPLSGLPGDGDTALTAAMRRLLQRNGLKPVDGDADFTLRAQAGVTPGKPGEEVLALAWTVADRNGDDLGSAAQQGAVPRGMLAGPWGSLANDIAAGGVDGVVEIVRAAQGK